METWKEWSVRKEGVPKGAVSGGYDRNRNLYVIRATHFNAGVIPGKYCEELTKAYVCYDGKEFEKDSFEILVCDKYEWVEGPGHYANLIQGGQDCDGKPIFIIRAMHDNCLVIGKYVSEKAYIPYNGREHEVKVFQLLQKY